MDGTTVRDLALQLCYRQALTTHPDFQLAFNLDSGNQCAWFESATQECDGAEVRVHERSKANVMCVPEILGY